jgi:hypothetical protein
VRAGAGISLPLARRWWVQWLELLLHGGWSRLDTSVAEPRRECAKHRRIGTGAVRRVRRRVLLRLKQCQSGRAKDSAGSLAISDHAVVSPWRAVGQHRGGRGNARAVSRSAMHRTRPTTKELRGTTRVEGPLLLSFFFFGISRPYGRNHAARNEASVREDRAFSLLRRPLRIASGGHRVRQRV